MNTVFLLLYSMDELIQYLERFKALGKNYFKLTFNTEIVKDEIIRVITIEQLYEQGIDEDGDLIQPEGYAPFTEEYKRATGQRFDNVTLNDTGAFYESFEVTVSKDSFTINADPNKEDTNLFDAYGVGILGLTEENRIYIIELSLEIVGDMIDKL